MNKLPMSRTVNRQSGLSMIELLIALAISSFLILGITQVYIDNKRNQLFQQSQANNQENSRFLVMLLDSYLNKVSFRRAPQEVQEYAFKALAATADCEAFKKESAITKAKGGTGVCLRYKPLISQELDCTGNQTPAFVDTKVFTEVGEPIVMTLRYKEDAELNGVLECKVGTNSAELLTGIADFRLEFGVGTPNIYDKRVSKIMAANDWTGSEGEILQVRYSALISSGPNKRSPGDSAVLLAWKKHATAGATTRLNTADKNHLYQLASSTVALRNLMP